MIIRHVARQRLGRLTTLRAGRASGDALPPRGRTFWKSHLSSSTDISDHVRFQPASSQTHKATSARVLAVARARLENKAPDRTIYCVSVRRCGIGDPCVPVSAWEKPCALKASSMQVRAQLQDARSPDSPVTVTEWNSALVLATGPGALAKTHICDIRNLAKCSRWRSRLSLPSAGSASPRAGSPRCLSLCFCASSFVSWAHLLPRAASTACARRTHRPRSPRPEPRSRCWRAVPGGLSPGLQRPSPPHALTQPSLCVSVP